MLMTYSKKKTLPLLSYCFCQPCGRSREKTEINVNVKKLFARCYEASTCLVVYGD